MRNLARVCFWFCLLLASNFPARADLLARLLATDLRQICPKQVSLGQGNLKSIPDDDMVCASLRPLFGLLDDERASATSLTFQLADAHLDLKSGLHRLGLFASKEAPETARSRVVKAIERYLWVNVELMRPAASFVERNASSPGLEQHLVWLAAVTEKSTATQVTAWLETVGGDVKPGLRFEKRDLQGYILAPSSDPSNTVVQVSVESNSEEGKTDLLLKGTVDDKEVSFRSPDYSAIPWLATLYHSMGVANLRFKLDAPANRAAGGAASACQSPVTMYGEPLLVNKPATIFSSLQPKQTAKKPARTGAVALPLLRLGEDGKFAPVDARGYRCVFLMDTKTRGWIQRDTIILKGK